MFPAKLLCSCFVLFFFTPGIITHGGERTNIIPAYSELNYCVRTTRVKELPELKAKVEACFRAAADATGCQVNWPSFAIPVFVPSEWTYIVFNNICNVALLKYPYALTCVLLLHYSQSFFAGCFLPKYVFSFSEMLSHHRAFIQHHKLFILSQLCQFWGFECLYFRMRQHLCFIYR